MNGRRSYKVQLAELLPMHPTPEQILAISAQIGCSPKTAQRCAASFGLTSPRKNKLPEFNELLRQLIAGRRPSDIASRYGASSVAVYRALQRRGYRIRRGIVFKINPTFKPSEDYSA